MHARIHTHARHKNDHFSILPHTVGSSTAASKLDQRSQGWTGKYLTQFQGYKELEEHTLRSPCLLSTALSQALNKHALINPVPLRGSQPGPEGLGDLFKTRAQGRLAGDLGFAGVGAPCGPLRAQWKGPSCCGTRPDTVTPRGETRAASPGCHRPLQRAKFQMSVSSLLEASPQPGLPEPKGLPTVLSRLLFHHTPGLRLRGVSESKSDILAAYAHSSPK